MLEAAVANALSPTVDSHVGSTISADADDDLGMTQNNQQQRRQQIKPNRLQL